MSVLVTDGNQRSALAVVRALGRCGISVTVGESEPSSLAGASRHCAQCICYPSPAKQTERFLDFLQNELRDGRYNILLPVTDMTMQLVNSAREALAPLVRMPFPGPAPMDIVQDKRRTLLQARATGVPCPDTYMLDSEEGLDEVAARVRYPVVIKPRFSRFRHDGRWVAGPVRYASDAKSLKAEYDRIHTLIPNPLVQERIEGEGRGVFLLVWNGELKAALCHRRLREKPPWGGVSVFSESMALDSHLVEKSFALLKSLDWQGVAMVEYKVDRRDGVAKLMEINGRFWGSLQLSIDAGINFPALLYRLAMGENFPSQFDYKVGAKNRWLLGDLDHLWMSLRYASAPNGLNFSSPSRLKAFIEFMKFFQTGLHYEVQRFDDPAPGWFEIKGYLRDIFHRSGTQGDETRAN